MNLSPRPKKNKAIWLLVSILLIIILGTLDYLTGYELAFSPFYLIAVITATWFVGSIAGAIFAPLSALVWLGADILAGHTYSNPAYFFWNTLLRLVNFLVVVALVARLKRELAYQNQLAHTDPITGLANTRWFLEFLTIETARVARYRKPISLVYFDLDNFKQVNDLFGHREGDRALTHVADALRGSLRKTDFIARIGGDEFAVILTETGVDEAPLVGEKIQEKLSAEMIKESWPITFSIGIISAPGGSNIIPPEAILHQADDLMYQVKKSGKNSLRCTPYQPEL
jgi:diguanylate cyclase (GGDEF)-like protein